MVPGTSTNDYVYANGMRIAKVSTLSDTTVSYYHSDSLGSVRLETTAGGTVVYANNYQPYGQNSGTPYCSPTCETYEFTGKPVSATTGLYHLPVARSLARRTIRQGETGLS